MPSIKEREGSKGVYDRLQRPTKHAALTETLRDLVITQRPGDRLPPRGELMRQYKVSDRTVLRSLEDLERAGLIERRPGSGTYVTDPRVRDHSRSQPEVSAEQSRTIALMAPHFFAASYLRLCANLLAEQTEEQGLSLVCHVARSYTAPDNLQEIESMKPRGFVLMGYPMVSIAEGLITHGHRAVIMGGPPTDTDPTLPCVCADHELGGELATGHLLDQGHRRIAFAFDTQMRYRYQRHPRWIGHQNALNALRQKGETVSDTVIDSERFAAWRADASLAAAYFRRPEAPTGIAVWNDSAAITLLGVLHRAGLRVPDDISLVGFDNIPEGEDSIPPLTTVDQHVAWQVQSVLRLLTRSTPPPPQAVITLPELKPRASCGPPTSS